jgi:single-strand DNA-binding protein
MSAGIGLCIEAGSIMLGGMGMETTGKLYKIGEAVDVTASFRKREFVVELTENNPRYPQYVQFQLTGDRCEQLDGYGVGDEVRVDFSLRGREWTSPQGDVKYFNSLNVWTLERAGAATGGGFADEEPPLPDGPPPGFDDVPF